MASRTVEIITSKYGNSVISNAASDETLRQLLKAVEGINEDLDTNSPKNRTSGTAAKGAVKNKLGGLNRQTKSTVSGIKNAGKEFGQLLLDGKTNFSDYGRALSDNLIRNLPIFGGALGTLADGLVSTVAIFESWNDKLRESSKSGAAFNNSILNFKDAAAQTFMSTDELLKLVVENSQKFLMLGDTVTDGAKIFTNFADKINNKEGQFLLEEMRYLGYSGAQTSEIFMRYVTTSLRGHRLNMLNYDRVIGQFKDYNKNMERLKNLFGKSRDEIADLTKEVVDDEIFKLKLSRMDEREQNKINQLLESAAVLGGESGTQLVKSQVLGIKMGNETVANFKQYMPELYNTIEQGAKNALNTGITVKEFTEYNERQLPNMVAAASRDISRLQKMFVSSDRADPEAKQAFDFTAKVLGKFGKLDDLTEDEIRKRMKTAKKEIGNIDELTKMLRDWGIFIDKLNLSFWKALSPALKQFGEYMQKKNLGDKLVKFGDWLGQKMAELIPKVFTFFENLGNPEFRRNLMSDFSYDMSIWALELKKILVKAMPGMPKWLADEYGRRKDKERRRLEKAQEAERNLREQSTQQTNQGAKLKQRPASEITEHVRQLRTQTQAQVDELKKKGFSISRPPTDSPYILGLPADAGKLTGNITGTEFRIAPGANVIAQRGGNISYYESDTLGLMALVYDPATNTTMVYRGLDVSRGNDAQRGLMAKYEKYNQVKEGDLIGIVGPGIKDSYGKVRIEVRLGKVDPTAIFGGWGQYLDPELFWKFRGGTLGSMGQGYKTMGPKGTPVALHGKEAVVSPGELNTALNNIGQISLADFITGLNSNVNLLISLTKEDLRIEKSKLSVQEKMKPMRG